MKLSSSTLFHYTRTRERLLSILRETFRPNFCLETAPFTDEDGFPIQNGTPMVCFCDIPLSAAANHMDRYGSYAIGLTKAWGVANGASPVMYTHAKSPISDGLRRLMGCGLRIGEGPLDRAVWDEVTRILAFTKPYEGRTTLNGKVKRTRFYDEREWRWVPQDLPPTIRYGIDSSQFENGVPAREQTAILQASHRLGFKPKDVRYIIVASEAEIVPMVEEILQIKVRFSQRDKTLLSTRVISAAQIRADF